MAAALPRASTTLPPCLVWRRAAGGLDAEREARAAFHQREREREARQVAALREIRQAGWRKVGMKGLGIVR